MIEPGPMPGAENNNVIEHHTAAMGSRLHDTADANICGKALARNVMPADAASRRANGDLLRSAVRACSSGAQQRIEALYVNGRVIEMAAFGDASQSKLQSREIA